MMEFTLTLEEAIKQYEQFVNIYENHNLIESQESQKVIKQLTAELEELQESKKTDSYEGYVKEFDKKYLLVVKQLIAWLRELQERRKEPEIIRCSECTYFKDNAGTVGYCKRKMMYQFKDYFCKDAIRKDADERDGENQWQFQN